MVMMIVTGRLLDVRSKKNDNNICTYLYIDEMKLKQGICYIQSSKDGKCVPIFPLMRTQ